MIPSEAKAANIQVLLRSKNCADTAGTSTGSWLDVRGFVGTLLVTQDAGIGAGTLDGYLLTTANSNGAGNAAMTFDDGNNFATVTTGNNFQAKTVDVNKSKGYIHYIGTVVTGPVALSVLVIGRPKEST
jgi:hypothetical protein